MPVGLALVLPEAEPPVGTTVVNVVAVPAAELCWVELEPEPEPVPVVVAVTVAVTVAVEDAEAELLAKVEALVGAVLVEEAEAEDDEVPELALSHDKSYRGLLVRVEPMTPKLGLGVVGDESWKVYHQTLVLPNMGQPTSSQNFFAFSSEGTAAPTVLPLTGQPVSVTQTGLPPTAP